MKSQNQADSFWEWVRTRFWPCFGWVHESGSEQYVGTVELDEATLERVLREAGFHRNPVAWLKTRSWTPLDSDGVSEGSWVRRDHFLAEMQLHVTLFSNDDGTYDLLAHREPSWIVSPFKHLNQGDLYQPLVGVDMTRRVLDAAGVTYQLLH